MRQLTTERIRFVLPVMSLRAQRSNLKSGRTRFLKAPEQGPAFAGGVWGRTLSDRTTPAGHPPRSPFSQRTTTTHKGGLPHCVFCNLVFQYFLVISLSYLAVYEQHAAWKSPLSKALWRAEDRMYEMVP